MPRLWLLHLRRWRDWNRSKKRLVDALPVPTRNDEYLLYQTLIGTWPTQALDDAGWKTYAERIEQYMLKVAREAKEHTSWANTNSEYEKALAEFTRALLHRSPQNRFLGHFEGFARRVARIGAFNSLSQALLKLTSPGVPDIYQGNELLEFDLVDPDNRRPVDYDARARLLDRIQGDTASTPDKSVQAWDLLSTCNGAAAKLYLTWKTLHFRRQQPGLFQRGSYLPLSGHGETSDHVVAFRREHEGTTMVVAVPRLCARLMGENRDTLCVEEVWRDSTLELPDDGSSCYHNLFTGECLRVEKHSGIPLSVVFRNFPVALLIGEPPGAAETCGDS
jgi:(1->4)-alpha-D-glucan 1-alpha-D-glucosylmutase